MLRSLFYKHVAQTSDSPMALEISHGKGNYLFDIHGKKYLDLIAGISVSNVGHGNPKVIEAIKSQADKHLHTLVYGEHIQTSQTALAQALAKSLPDPIDQIYFVNSGSEAIEGAMKLAKRYTGRFEIVACHKAYHGSSHGALSLMGNEDLKQKFRPLLPGIRHLEFGKVADLEFITTKTAAIVMETVQGEAGVRIADTSYFQEARKRCTEVGCLLILDEIQTGFGRTGSFWGFEKYDIVPDVVVMAKGMGGGMPLGAFAARKSIMECLTKDPVLGHITTFGGHPVSCAASLAALQFIQYEGLTDQVQQKEKRFHQKLRSTSIKEIRSSGLLMAVELGSFDKVMSVIQYGLKQGLITDWFLFCNTAIRIAPPLTISLDEIDWACDVILESLKSGD